MSLRIDWDEYFILQALIVSARSTCERKKVGAVIVKDNRVISTGYNGKVAGMNECDGAIICMNENGSCDKTIHAEINAIIRVGLDAKDSTVYCTHSPCPNCFRVMANAGVKHIKYIREYRNKEAFDMAEQLNISMEPVKVRFDMITQIIEMISESEVSDTYFDLSEDRYGE